MDSTNNRKKTICMQVVRRIKGKKITEKNRNRLRLEKGIWPFKIHVYFCWTSNFVLSLLLRFSLFSWPMFRMAGCKVNFCIIFCFFQKFRFAYDFQLLKWSSTCLKLPQLFEEFLWLFLYCFLLFHYYCLRWNVIVIVRFLSIQLNIEWEATGTILHNCTCYNIVKCSVNSAHVIYCSLSFRLDFDPKFLECPFRHFLF